MHKFLHSNMSDQKSRFTTLYITFNLVIVFCILSVNMAQKVHNASRTDLMKCKLTQIGFEYRGSIAKTVGDIRCQAWYAEEPIHEVSKDITDNEFPEGSMKDAKNYCRNPTMDVKGPWCYTMDPLLIDDRCDIPLCNFGECRLSGPGAEYGGSRKISASGRECKSWHKHYKSATGKNPKFQKENFPEGSVKKAESFCRNPSGDFGGPWCYIEEEQSENVEKEYCDVSFCDERDCVIFAKNTSNYSILTKLDAPGGNITVWIKLWNPSDERKGIAKILLSVLPIPFTPEQIAEEWTAGVELEFANSGSRQSFPKYDDEDFEKTPEILLGTKWTGLWISWGDGFISAGIEGTSKPLIMQEYKKKRGTTSLYPDTFLYYGLGGSSVLWNTVFCDKRCEIHTTLGIDFSRVWSTQKGNDTNDVRFFVRASQNVHIRLYQTPTMEYPSATVIIGKDITTLIYQESEESVKHYLKEISSKGYLDIWSWREFSISIFGEHLRLFSQKFRGAIELFYANEKFFATLRWFSIGSENSIAHWTLFCAPEESEAVEEPWPPNCISDIKAYDYKGSQWTAVNEVPCGPWIAKEVSDEDKFDNKFVDGSALKALNKCRNPTRDPTGPYCYAFTPWETEIISKQHCIIRNCKSSECRMAGTANDYVGTLSETRAGYLCDKWPRENEVKPESSTAPPVTKRTRRPIVKLPQINYYNPYSLMDSYSPMPPKPTPKPTPKPSTSKAREYFNETLYPDGSITNASNYCRNPSRNIAGTWCYVANAPVSQDLCNVRDCEKSEEYTFLVRGDGIGRNLYILPEHRIEGLRFSLKAWEPDQPDTITFVFKPDDDSKKSRYILKIGADDNEKVLLYHEPNTGGVALVKKKTLPHLLYLGRWSNFILRIPRGQILLFYEDDPTPLFEWSYSNPSIAFLPGYYYYSTEKGRAVGISYDQSSSCLIENTKTDKYSRILSLAAWSRLEVLYPDQVTLHLRGKGVISIPLFLMLAIPGFNVLTFNEAEHTVVFTRNVYPTVTVFHKQRTSIPLYTTHSWTNITIKWSQKTMEILVNSTNIFRYEHVTPHLFYFFSVGVESGGWVTWTVNCEPPDIDGPPVDGGWSEWGPWTCSASCNGGTGARKRRCDSPKPNIKGESCVGPDTMTGRCNEIPCGDVSEDTVALINRRIRTNYTALIVKEFKSVVIESDSDIVTLIITQSPRSKLQWSLNGIFVQKETSRIKLKDHNVEISKASPSDAGVYAMTLRRVDGTYSIIKVVSLAVIPAKENKQVRETLSLTVMCHCTILGHIYSDLRVSWSVQKKTWKDFGITVPAAADVMQVLKVNRTHEGMWQCVVTQGDLKFEWTTNIIFIKILGPPNWRTHLMEDDATHFFFGWISNEEYVGVFALIVFLVSITAVIIGSIHFLRITSTKT